MRLFCCLVSGFDPSPQDLTMRTIDFRTPTHIPPDRMPEPARPATGFWCRITTSRSPATDCRASVRARRSSITVEARCDHHRAVIDHRISVTSAS